MANNMIALQARAPQMISYNELVAGRDQQMARKNAMALQQQTMQQNAATRSKTAQSEAAMRQALAMAQKGDIAGAQEQFGLGAGNMDVYTALNKVRGDQTSQLQAKLTAVAAPALEALSTPDPQARAAIFQNATPQLVAQGWTPEQIANFPLSDDDLKRAISNAQDPGKALDMYNEQQKPRVITPGSALVAGGKKIFEQPANDPQGTIKEIMGTDGKPQLVRIVGDRAYPVGMGGNDLVSGPRGGDTFSRMIGVESGGQQFARNGGPLTSPKGAVGVAQVMPATAPEAARLAGLVFDEKRYRTDPEYNRAIGKAYFDKQLADFGDERLAAAAYNAGPGAVRRALQKGGPDGWINYVPRETQDYVGKVFGGNDQRSAVRPVPSATQTKIEQKQRETHKVAGAIGSKIDGQIANIDALINSKGLNEITGNIRGNIPGTLMSIASQGAANALAKYKTIVANATLTELQELKATSPTGGALGAVSDAENQMLRDAAATLDRAQDLQTFKTALIDYKTKLQNAKNRLLRAYEEDFGQAYGAYSGGSSRAAPAKGGGGGWGSAKVVGD